MGYFSACQADVSEVFVLSVLILISLAAPLVSEYKVC